MIILWVDATKRGIFDLRRHDCLFSLISLTGTTSLLVVCVFLVCCLFDVVSALLVRLVSWPYKTTPRLLLRPPASANAGALLRGLFHEKGEGKLRPKVCLF